MCTGTPDVITALGRLPTDAAGRHDNVNLVERRSSSRSRSVRVDMRFAKVLRFGRTRADVGIDLYNVFNTNVGTTFNGNYGSDGATWLRPTAISTRASCASM